MSRTKGKKKLENSKVQNDLRAPSMVVEVASMCQTLSNEEEREWKKEID